MMHTMICLMNWEDGLKAYFRSRILQRCLNVLAFLNVICLFFFLIFLPVEIAYSWIISSSGVISHLQQNFDLMILMFFLLHILIFLHRKLKKIIEQPYHKVTITFRGRQYRDKWLRLLKLELIYDFLCFILALVVYLVNPHSRFILLFYLPKIYKLTVFNAECSQAIMGSYFQAFYNIFYGICIFLILTSYVGCAFYLLDYSLYQQQQRFQYLLWIVDTPAIENLVGQSFFIQFQYTMYWSIGTASTAAYGDISAAEPTDIIFNILCLFFSGFVFGYYISRVHDLPNAIRKKEKNLLETFEKAQADQRKLGKDGLLSRELKFEMLCSIQYQQNCSKSQKEFLSILPLSYQIELKMVIHKQFLNSALPFFQDEILKQKVALKIEEVITEDGEEVFAYTPVHRNDLLFLSEGTVEKWLHVEPYLKHVYREGDSMNLFNFATGLSLVDQSAICKDYCRIYRLGRKEYRQSLDMDGKIKMDRLFHEALGKGGDWLANDPLFNWNRQLRDDSPIAMFVPTRRRSQTSSLLQELEADLPRCSQFKRKNKPAIKICGFHYQPRRCKQKEKQRLKQFEVVLF